MDTNWDGWPTCPECGRRRQTVCSVCGHAGIEFDLAEFLAPLESVQETRGTENDAAAAAEDVRLEVLLMCPQCDEAFSPQFYRRCHDCGHDFGEGIEIAQREVAPLSPRVTLVIFGMAVLCIGVLAYFWWLLN